VAWPLAVPLLCLTPSSGLAAGMMLSASLLLLFEGVDSSQHVPTVTLWHPHVLGCLAGVAFIYASKRWLDHHHDLKFSGLEGAWHPCVWSCPRALWIVKEFMLTLRPAAGVPCPCSLCPPPPTVHPPMQV
jgi:zinc transporter ZupT